MSVLIKGMEIPKSCFECIFMLHRCFCLVNPKIEFTDKEYSELKGRYVGCPLTDVPTPRGRLGDLDELHNHLNEWYLTHEHGFSETEKTYIRAMLSGVKDSPTIIEAEEAENDS